MKDSHRRTDSAFPAKPSHTTKHFSSGRYTSLVSSSNVEQLYTKCVNKGESLFFKMMTDDGTAGRMFESPHLSASTSFTDIRSVKEQGYEKWWNCCTDIGLNQALWEAAEMKNYNLQEVEYMFSAEFKDDDGGIYSSYSGYFKQFINPIKGVIVAADNFSPAKSDPPPIKIPKLCRWSDIAFLQYFDTAQKWRVDTGDLKYVFRYWITNTETKDTIYKICDKSGAAGELKAWPGKTYKSDTEEYKALLGTPNGLGVAWLLIQHKGLHQLGHKAVDSVTVFLSDRVTYCNPSLLFRIKKVHWQGAS